MSYRLNSYLCEDCGEGKLKWKRKSTNIFGNPLRYYKCDYCLSVYVDIELNCKKIQLGVGGKLLNEDGSDFIRKTRKSFSVRHLNFSTILKK